MCIFRPLKHAYVIESLNVAASIVSLCMVVPKSIVGMDVVGGFSIKHD